MPVEAAADAMLTAEVVAAATSRTKMSDTPFASVRPVTRSVAVLPKTTLLPSADRLGELTPALPPLVRAALTLMRMVVLVCRYGAHAF